MITLRSQRSGSTTGDNTEQEPALDEGAPADPPKAAAEPPSEP
ncbi:hypothetical protein DB30_02549 [Enhygromyxa salina]|uniref:Uncharacterized protein n=1 Tax=Enhygromyxa salina TaxID=215803 RepID=A0A0C2CKP2_9BACT|nr:hypothetical protein [Enhygromyxa salina]KIG11771.1 hypothetical protein DB30_02549 [Enhygromyxa salina]